MITPPRYEARPDGIYWRIWDTFTQSFIEIAPKHKTLAGCVQLTQKHNAAYNRAMAS